MSSDRTQSIQVSAQQIEVTDEHGVASLVESLVISGDISQLTQSQRVWYYGYRCRQLRLDPSSKPFDVLALNSKLVLYLNRWGSDQLARVWNVTRKVVDGPKVIDINGTKVVYCLVEASLPDGRTETDVGTVPLTDPVNVYLKCISKAKRRATIAITGAGHHDESEMDDVPAHHKAPASLLGTNEPHRPLQPIRDDLAQLERPITIGQASAIWVDHDALVTPDTAEDVRRLMLDALPPETPVRHLNIAVAAERGARKERASKPAPVAAVVAPVFVPSPGAPTVDDFVREYDLAKSRDEVAAVAADVKALGFPRGGDAFKRLAAAYRQALARLGKQTPPATDATTAAPETIAQDGSQADLLAAITKARACNGPVHLCAHVAKHVGELPAAQQQPYREQVAWYARRAYPKTYSTEADAIADILAAEAEAAQKRITAVPS